MHEGKALKKLVREDERKVQEISEKLGISRGYIYELYKQADLGDYFRKRVKEAGIILENGMTKDDKRQANLNGLLTLKTAGGNLLVNDLILMSIEQLIKLQGEQEDGSAQKAIAQVIMYKQYAESLERENKVLKDMIEMQKEKIEDLKKPRK